MAAVLGIRSRLQKTGTKCENMFKISMVFIPNMIDGVFKPFLDVPTKVFVVPVFLDKEEEF